MPYVWNPAEGIWRFYLIRTFLVLGFIVVVARLIQVQIVDREKYIRQAMDQSTRELVEKGDRGLILDRNQTPLAMNKPCFDIGVDKNRVENLRDVSKKLAKVLRRSERVVYSDIRSSKNFSFIARGLDDNEASIIKMMKLPGVRVIKSTKRAYPFNEKLAPVLGFVDIDGKGISGIEMEFESHLSGQKSRSRIQRDAHGNPLLSLEASNSEAQNGQNVVLSIDHVYQTIVEQELQRAVEENNAKGGTVIAIEPVSGRILSMASFPNFDANRPYDYKPDTWRIRAVTDIFEPGSTFKVVLLAAALSEHVDREVPKVFCENGTYRILGEEINDSKEHGELTFDNVFIQSSNIGTAKLAARIGKLDLFSTSRRFGFGNRTGVALPGEVTGILKMPKSWSGFSLYAIAYGHEVAVTPLQIAMAYGAIANGGKLMKPLIVDEIRTADGHINVKYEPDVIRQIMSEELVDRMTQILENVVEEGTGIAARIPEMSIAGKTGTAQKPLPDGSGYSNQNYVSSFAGFYPSHDASILIYVALDEPKPAHSGGEVAAPTFKRILKRILEVDDKLEYRPRANLQQRLAGSNPVQAIPDFTDRRADIARRILEQQYGIQPTFSGEGQLVTNQKILAASEPQDEPQIVLSLNSYPDENEYTTVPAIENISLREAICKLTARGLNVVIVGRGRVVEQKPAAGTQIRVGARCFLICKPVSEGLLQARL